MTKSALPRGAFQAGKLRLAVALTVSGFGAAFVGIVLGRGEEQGMALVELRLLLLSIGCILATAGTVGLVAAARSRASRRNRG